MSDAILHLFPPYLVAFALLAFLPNWRWLLAGLIVALSLVVWAYNDVTRSDGNGLGIVIAAVWLFVAGLGLVAGALARGIVLFGRSNNWSLVRTIIVHPVVFFSVPLLLAGWLSLENEQRKAFQAPPEAACAEGVHRAVLGEVELALPISRAIRVGEGFEYNPSWMFEINDHARRFCRQAQLAPPQLTNIQIDLGTRTSVQSSTLYESAFCRSQQPYAWWASSCRRETLEPSRDFPEETTIYVIGRYNAAKMHAWAVENRSLDRREMARLPQARLDGGAVVYTGQHQRYFTLDARPEFLAQCHEMTKADGAELGCVGGQPIGDGLGLIVEFRADQPTFASDAEHALARAREILDSLKAK